MFFGLTEELRNTQWSHLKSWHDQVARVHYGSWYGSLRFIDKQCALQPVLGYPLVIQHSHGTWQCWNMFFWAHHLHMVNLYEFVPWHGHVKLPKGISINGLVWQVQQEILKEMGKSWNFQLRFSRQNPSTSPATCTGTRLKPRPWPRHVASKPSALLLGAGLFHPIYRYVDMYSCVYYIYIPSRSLK